jgi:hypothetical protein
MLGNRKQNEINPHPDKDENCSGSRTGDDSGKLRLQMFYQINSSTCFFGKKTDMSSGEIHLELCQGDLPIAICIHQPW